MSDFHQQIVSQLQLDKTNAPIAKALSNTLRFLTYAAEQLARLAVDTKSLEDWDKENPSSRSQLEFVRLKAFHYSLIFSSSPFTEDECPFCLSTRGKGGCSKCWYGKVGGKCTDDGSVYSILKSAFVLCDSALSLYSNPDAEKDGPLSMSVLVREILGGVYALITQLQQFCEFKSITFKPVVCTMFGHVYTNPEDIVKNRCLSCAYLEEEETDDAKCSLRCPYLKPLKLEVEE